MNEQIAIQASTRVADGQGGYTKTWATIATEWAQVVQVSYDRLMLDSGVKFTKVVEFQLRERKDTYTLTGSYRIYWNSEAYTIYSVVTNDERTTVLAYVEG